MKRALWLALLLVVLVATPAAAQSPEDLANDISKKVMSPYCPGVTLHDCPSQSALDLRDDIEGYARSGMDEAAIMQRLERDFGPSIRAEPSSEGAGVLAWILPSLVVLAGGVLAWWLVRRWSARRSPSGEAEAPPAIGVSHSEQRRLDAELAQLRKQS
ncbi:MAG: cytochrome c-type biogenesis protein [Actinomycetota bacterium]